MGQSDDLTGHPDLGAIGASMRSEWAAEQDDAAREAHEHYQRHQSLRDWLIAAMHGGDRIAVTVVEQRFTGLIEEVGDDLIALRAIFGRVDVHVAPGIPMHIEPVDHPAQGGTRGRTDGSFGTSLAARDANADMSVGTVFHPEGLDGVMAVGSDFVIVTARAGAVTVIPLAQVAWVSARAHMTPEDEPLEPLDIDDRSPGERMVAIGREGLASVKAIVDDGRLDVAAVLWMLCAVATVGVGIYSALRSTDFGAGGGTWAKITALGTIGGPGIAVFCIAGIALAVPFKSPAARFALLLALAVGGWVVVSAGCDLASVLHDSTSRDAGLAAGDRAAAAVQAVAYGGFGAVVVLVVGSITRRRSGGH